MMLKCDEGESGSRKGSADKSDCCDDSEDSARYHPGDEDKGIFAGEEGGRDDDV